MIAHTRNPYDVQKLTEYFRKLLSRDCTIELKEKKPIRSREQNAYLHVILSYFASEYGCSMDEAKVDFYKRAANREIFEEKVVNKKGNEITALRSTTTLDTREMTLTIERFRNWSSAVAKIYLPAPHEDEFIAHCLKCIEEDREYL